MNILLNIALIVMLLLGIGGFLYYFFRLKATDINENEIAEDILSVDYLTDHIKTAFNNILRTNIAELNLNQTETEKKKKNKAKLRRALKICNHGDIGSKEYLKDYIKNLLQREYHINEDNIDRIIPFDNGDLTTEYKFFILLQIYKERYQLDALTKLILHYELDKRKIAEDGIGHFEINAEDINRIYQRENNQLSFMTKLELLSQIIYQSYKGYSVIDEIRDMKIDGVSAGVSGIPSDFYSYTDQEAMSYLKEIPFSYNSIWIFFQGKSIHMSFLGFRTQRELERVCKNIYKYNNPGQLSEVTGYIVNEMKDGSRVVVMRPGFCESWVFFLRKFDSIVKAEITELITDDNHELPRKCMKFLIKGCQNIAITGRQGCGKTTLLKSLIDFIDSSYNLRVQEMTFELYLRKLYTKRNIVTLRETATISGQEALDITKKTDGTVNICGEISTAPVAGLMIQMSQVASLFTLFTHHAKTTVSLIVSLTNSFMQTLNLQDIKMAEAQVAEAINFDVHMDNTTDGHRYIERITEVIPLRDRSYSGDVNQAMIEFFTKMTDRRTFEVVDIIVFDPETKSYVFKHAMSQRAVREICKYLNAEEKTEFLSQYGSGDAYE